MTNRELLYIRTIAQEKSVSKAAEKLFVSQPSLSQCVSRLEERLGVQLFIRTNYGLNLTYAGEKYVNAANNILKIYADFKNDVADEHNLIAGRLTIGLTYVISYDLLPKILPTFKENYPNIEIALVEENTAELEKKLLSGEIDFAITHNHPRIPITKGLEEKCRLQEDPFILVCSKNHPILEKSFVDDAYDFPMINLKDCENETFIMVHPGQRIRQITNYMLQTLQIAPEILLTTQNCYTAKSLASKGLGICLLPLKYANSFINTEDEYQYCHLTHKDAYWSLSVMTLKTGYLSNAANKFIEILQDSGF